MEKIRFLYKRRFLKDSKETMSTWHGRCLRSNGRELLLDHRIQELAEIS